MKRLRIPKVEELAQLARDHDGIDAAASIEGAAGFFARRGTGPMPFCTRLARARLLFLRRREHAANWLALGVLLAAWAIDARLPLP